MKCDFCPTEAYKVQFVGDGKYACKHCIQTPTNENFLISKIVTFHDSEGKPIKATQARIDMIRRRYLSPEDNVTVLERNAMGKRIDRKAVNY